MPPSFEVCSLLVDQLVRGVDKGQRARGQGCTPKVESGGRNIITQPVLLVHSVRDGYIDFDPRFRKGLFKGQIEGVGSDEVSKWLPGN